MYPSNEKQRLAALLSFQVLDTPSEEEFDRLTELASMICEVPIALVSLIDKDRQWFKSKKGLDVCETPRDISFCQYAILGKETFIVEDATQDNRFKKNPLVTGFPNIRFYAGCPLIDPNGFELGTLCIIDTVSRKLNTTQLNALSILTKEVVCQIVARKNKNEKDQADKLFQISNDLICIANTDGYFKKINPAFTNLLGWTEAEFLIKPFVDFIHPDDLEVTSLEVNKLSQGQVTVNFTNRYKTKLNQYKIISWSAKPNTQSGEIYAIGRDITELARTQKELLKTKEILELTNKVARIGAWEFDLVNNEIYWAQVTKEIHGVPADYVPNFKTVFEFYKSDKHQVNFLQLFNEIKVIGGEFNQEFILVTANGKELWVNANGKAEFKNGVCERVYGTFQDISEKKVFELEFQKNQARLNEAQKISKIGNWEFNLKSNELYWSAELFKIFEIDEKINPHQLYAQYRSRIRPKDLNILDSMVENSIRTGKGYTIEHEIFFENGNRVKHILGIAKIINDAEGKPILLAGIAQDITERILIQKNLKVHEERWQYAFEASGDGIWDWNPINQKTFYSNRWLSMLGYAVSDLTDSDKEWSSRVHPEDISQVFSKINDNLVGKTESFVHEYRFLNKKGQYVWVLNRGKVVERNLEGLATRVIGTHSDISEQKSAEQKLLQKENWIRSLISNMDDLVFVLDQNYIFKEYFQKASNSLLISPELFIGKHFMKVGLPVEVSLIIKTALDNCALTKESQKAEYKIELSNILKFFDLGVSCVCDEKGLISDFICVARDITKQKYIENDIVHSKELAIAANKAKSEFLANMSHEIRTPLNGVIGFTDLLMNTKLDSTQQLYTSTINNSAKSLLDIINDILDFSKIEAGKIEIENQQVDIEQLINETANIVSYQCQSKNLELCLNISPDIPQFIWTDPIRLRQILVNLCSNAVKFTERGEVELKVEIISQDQMESRLKFSVRDTGMGIESNKIDGIFKPFTQEDTSITRKFGGTGLGLTISNKLLMLMNGSQIQVKSEKGKGSVFYFDAMFKSQKNINQGNENLEKFKQILVVNSNESRFQIKKQLLKKYNIGADYAKDGSTALLKLTEGSLFDAAIIDFDLPDMSGIELIKQMRNSLNPTIKNLPIIFVYSSISNLDLNLFLIELGVKQQLLRPFHSHHLIAALSKLNQKIESNEIAPDLTTQLKNLNSKSILIVDDNKVNLLLTKTILKKILPNPIIFEAKDGIEAIEVFKSNKLDFVFMDIQMPKLNGYQTTIEIRKIEKSGRIPIVALTAGAVLGEKERCLEAGMDDYISKPFVKDTIIKMLDKYLSVYKTA